MRLRRRMGFAKAQPILRTPHEMMFEFRKPLTRKSEGAMKNVFPSRSLACLLGALVLSPGAIHAQGTPPPDHPAVTVKGQTYTPRSILARNMGTEADRITAFPPHRIIGN